MLLPSLPIDQSNPDARAVIVTMVLSLRPLVLPVIRLFIKALLHSCALEILYNSRSTSCHTSKSSLRHTQLISSHLQAHNFPDPIHTSSVCTDAETMGDQSFDNVTEEVEQRLVEAQSPRTNESQGAEEQWGQTCFTAPFRLFDLPEEIQRQILALVLTVQVKEARQDGLGGEETVLVLPHAEPRYERDAGVFEGDRRMPRYSGLMQHWQHLGVPRERLAVLTVSRHFYEHGSAALYGLYHFRTYCSEAFRVLFTKHIGAANTANIKSLTMGLPHALKTMPSKYLGRYLYLLSVGMPKLNQLKVTTKFGRWYYPTTYQPAHPWVECHRGMLWFASWVTLRHEGLKFAVWDERNTVWGNKIEADKAIWFDNRIVELCVTITRYKPKGLESMIDFEISGAGKRRTGSQDRLCCL